MRTPVYVKLDAADQLLLGEGVCRQLRIITYHPSVTAKRSRSIKSDHTTAPTARAGRRDLDSTSREPIHQRPNKESGATSRPGLQHHRRTRSWSGARAALQDTPQTSITSTENESTGTGERNEIKHSPQTSQSRGSTALLPLGLNRNVPLVGQGEDHQTHTTEPEMVATATAATQTRQDHMENDADEEAVVPTVRVRLVTSLCLPPYKSVRAQVEVDPGNLPPGPWMLQDRSDAEETLGICGEDVVIDPGGKQVIEVLLSNHSGFTCHLDAEEFLGTAVPAEVVDPRALTPWAPRQSQDNKLISRKRAAGRSCVNRSRNLTSPGRRRTHSWSSSGHTTTSSVWKMGSEERLTSSRWRSTQEMPLQGNNLPGECHSPCARKYWTRCREKE